MTITPQPFLRQARGTVAIALWLAAAGAAAAQKVSFQDPAGDDNGPGAYVYPTDPVYTPGSFDMTDVTMKVHKDTVDVEITMKAKLADAWHTGSGFSVQTVVLFLQTDGPEQSVPPKDKKTLRAEKRAAAEKLAEQKLKEKEGGPPVPPTPPKVRKPYGFTQGLPGMNVQFAPADGWDHCVILSPLPAAQVQAAVDAKVAAAQRGAVIVPARVKGAGHVISATFDRKPLGKHLPKTWGYQVAVVGTDPYPGTASLFVRPVADAEGQLRFGGGAGNACDANVLDILAGDAQGDAAEIDKQHTELQGDCSAADPKLRKLPTLSLVYIHDEDEVNGEEKKDEPPKPPGSP